MLVLAALVDTLATTVCGSELVPVTSTSTSRSLCGICLAGPSFQTNNTYLFGSYSAEIKLVPGNSAGTVAAFFVSLDDHTNCAIVYQPSAKHSRWPLRLTPSDVMLHRYQLHPSIVCV